MKKRWSALGLTFLFLTGCTYQSSAAQIVTTLFPHYDLARAVVGEHKSVSLLTPLGSEVHGYEPSSSDIINIQNAELFLYTSTSMERWYRAGISEGVNDLNLEYSFIKNSINDDLHYWTDPLTVLEMLTAIKDAIITIDSGNAGEYSENAADYALEISNLHESLVALISAFHSPQIFFYGHNALASFGKRYGLDIVSLSDNYQPDADLSPGQITALKEKIIAAETKYLFIEELISWDPAIALQKELAKSGYPLTILELHGFHNISQKQYDDGVTYVDLLRQNLINLEIALV